MNTTALPPAASLDLDRFGHPRYLVRKQVFRLFGEGFHVYDSLGRLAFFCKLKAFRLKEDLRVFTDESERTPVLAIRARNILDVVGVYDVVDPATGERVGALRRAALKSLLRDEWLILDRDDRQVGTIREDSLALALVRRFLSNLIPQTFHVALGNQTVCEFRQRFNPFIRKVEVDFGPDPGRTFDRRLGLAAGLLLTAIEGRQG
jgi:uncharacterized protein YxjI